MAAAGRQNRRVREAVLQPRGHNTRHDTTPHHINNISKQFLAVLWRLEGYYSCQTRMVSGVPRGLGRFREPGKEAHFQAHFTVPVVGN